jgi:hypothetical protein
MPVLASELLLRRSVLGRSRGCGEQRVAEGDLLRPAGVIGEHQVQMGDPAIVGHLDEEPAPGTGVQFRGDVVPAVGREAQGDGGSDCQLSHWSLQVDDRLGGQARNGRRSDVLDLPGEPGREQVLQPSPLDLARFAPGRVVCEHRQRSGGPGGPALACGRPLRS